MPYATTDASMKMNSILIRMSFSLLINPLSPLILLRVMHIVLQPRLPHKIDY